MFCEEVYEIVQIVPFLENTIIFIKVFFIKTDAIEQIIIDFYNLPIYLGIFS